MKLAQLQEAKYAQSHIFDKINLLIRKPNGKSFVPIDDYDEAYTALVNRIGEPKGYALPNANKMPFWIIKVKGKKWEIILADESARATLPPTLYVHPAPMKLRNLKESRYPIHNRTYSSVESATDEIADLLKGHYINPPNIYYSSLSEDDLERVAHRLFGKPYNVNPGIGHYVWKIGKTSKGNIPIYIRIVPNRQVFRVYKSSEIEIARRVDESYHSAW